MAPSRVPRSAWTDDDGSGMFGTVINNAELQKIYDGIDQLHSGNAPFTILEVGGGFRSAYMICPDASGLSNIGGGAIAWGQVAPARLGAGTPNATTVLRGDGVWALGGQTAPPYAGLAGSPFTATTGYFYNLVGPGSPNGAYIVLPYLSTAGNGSVIGFCMKEQGSWGIYAQANEPIVGQNPYIYDWPIYSTLVLKADPAGSKWDIV